MEDYLYPNMGHMGHETGQIFQSRRDLAESGLHSPHMQGIWNAGTKIAHSIILSGGYSDDVDHQDWILYTGQGGQENRKQVADQELKLGNLGLYNAMLEGFPVRVTRGAQVENGPEQGYRYDGLYRVIDARFEPSTDGPKIWRFEMEPYSNDDIHQLEKDRPLPETAPLRVETTTQRIVRNTSMISKLKKQYDDTCQLCDLRITLANGAGYSEGAHVKPLARNGPDVKENVLILCPNHHVMLDRKSIMFNSDNTWSSGTDGGIINFRKNHFISSEYLDWNNDSNI